MGIQINGQTDTVTSTTAGGSVKVTPLAASTGLNVGTGASISSPATNVLALGTNNSERVRIASGGFVGIGTANPDSIFYVGYGADAIVNGYDNSRLVVNDSGNRQADVFARNHVDDVMIRLTAGQTNVSVGSISNHPIDFCINNSNVLRIETSGNVIPFADNTYNLGSSSYRWANIYSADLQLSNEGSSNDVDGTWGKYTIQEGENDLFLINRRTGKKYKFLLEEVK